MKEEFTVDIFRGYTDICPVETTLESIVEQIRTDAALAEHTAKHRYCREKGWDTDARNEKSACPCFAVAVRFKGGKTRENICGWTHLCLADFDHLPAEALEDCLDKIRKDPHTLLAYTTVGGGGIRVLSRYKAFAEYFYRTDTELYKVAFEQMNRYYAALIGHPYDPQCKNITRLSGLAHDPAVYFNPDAQPIEVTSPATTSRTDPEKTDRRLKRIVAVIETRLAKEGVEYAPHKHNHYIMRTGYLLNAYGIPLETATRWALQRFADYHGDVPGIFRSCYQHQKEHGTLHLTGQDSRKSNETEENTVAAIEAYLAAHGLFRKNIITGKCEVSTDGGNTYTDLTDRHVNSLWKEMCKEVRMVRSMDMRALLDSDLVELYNPFTAYFNDLPEWDRHTDPIAKLAAQVHIRTGAELFPLLFKKWLVAMVASLLHEEVVNHEILVLLGRQGIYKTTWLNHLLPPELRRYFYLKSNSRNISKDDLLVLSEFAIVCLEELDELNDRELSQLKALTTQQHINERAAYAHYKEIRPHLASFCGTGNNLHFLTDPTGNRRWMPFEVESIDSPYEHPVDYKAVYAQAYALVKEGFPYWLNDEELQRLNEHNRLFEAPNLERELILTYYQVPAEGEECVFVTNAQILMRINAGLRHTLSPVKLGIIMAQEGFQAIRVGGKRGYRVIELTGEQIEQRKRWVTHWQ